MSFHLYKLVFFFYVFVHIFDFINANHYSDKIFQSKEFDFIDVVNSVSNIKDNILLTTKHGLNMVLSEGRIQNTKNDYSKNSLLNMSFNLDKSKLL